jgi:hypothetical protein
MSLLCDFKQNWNMGPHVIKTPQYLRNFMKYPFQQPSSFCMRRDEQTNRKTDMSKFMSEFLQFVLVSMPEITKRNILPLFRPFPIRDV